MFTHGSPKTSFSAGTVHEVLPTHAAETFATDVDALHVEVVKLPHEPFGVP